MPKSLPEDAYAAYYDESFIYFTAQDGEEFNVILYNISKGKVTRETKLADATENSSVIKNGKLYLVTNQTVPAVYVIDLKTGDTLYEGEITLEKQTADKKSDELYINGIDVN
jgi:Tol biopolymer transport system component